MLSIISCAKHDSKRLPGKNWKLLNGKPLIQYTIDTMLYLKEYLNAKCCVITDSQECSKIAKDNNIPVLIDKKTGKGMDFNRWVHEEIKADNYVLLQPTNPLRDNFKTSKWTEFCVNSRIRSAFSVYIKDRENYIMNGNFFYYHYSQLLRNDLIDEDSIIFKENVMLDINTNEDFEKAKKIYEN